MRSPFILLWSVSGAKFLIWFMFEGNYLIYPYLERFAFLFDTARELILCLISQVRLLRT